MANIWSLLGNNQVATNYTNIANMYVTQWQKFATASTGDHLTLSVSALHAHVGMARGADACLVRARQHLGAHVQPVG
jgi:hypothetical protein